MINMHHNILKEIQYKDYVGRSNIQVVQRVEEYI